MSTAEYSMHGAVAVIQLNNPPMNTLAHPLRQAVYEHLQKALADGAVKAVVIIGGGRAFCAGAEIREFNTPKVSEPPATRDIMDAFEGAKKPVVAAIHGVAMGGGLEFAMSCHFRVAAPDAQLALPEVKLGILPGAGGTQRLPRALGVERALDMMTTGNPVRAAKFAGTALVDELVEGDLLAGALAFANRVVAEGRPLRRLRDMSATLDKPDAFFAEARSRIAKASRGFPAPLKIVDCVEAAVRLPFDEGIKVERSKAEELVATTESKALRHAFFGERAVAKIPDVPEDTKKLEVRNVALIGAGTMGGGIAMALANAGIPVKLLDTKQQALDQGLATIRKNYANTVSRGRLSQQEMDQRLERISTTLSYEEVRNADLVIEAVFEDMAVKREVFRKLDELMKPGAILATNTSTLDVNTIASFTTRPESVVGLHFFSPANVMRLLEIVRGAKTSKEVLATVMHLARTIKKVGIVAGVCDGFIGNRMLERYFQQAYFLLDEGALPQEVDRALQDWGMAMGPFTMSDMAGNDISWYVRKRRYVDHPDFPYSKIPDLVCERGRFGQKTGSGYYKYEAGNRKPIPDAEVEQLIGAHRKQLGIKERRIGEEEIVERCVLAMANEGARILEEGIALRAVDIDMVYLTGYGFPPYRGGPMFYADTVGLAKVLAAIEKYAAGYHGEVWQAAPLLARLAREGKTFN